MKTIMAVVQSTRARLILLTVLLAVTLGSAAPAAHAIINGTPTTSQQWDTGGRWKSLVALVEAGQTPITGQFCGGTLVDPQWVLTAAHCVTDLQGTQSPASSFNVLAGRRTLSATGGQRISVERVVVHPGWDATRERNDLALIKLTAPVLGSVGAPLPLLTDTQRDFAGPGVTGFVAGWGNRAPTLCDPGCLDQPADYPDTAEEVAVPIRADATCGAHNAPGHDELYIAATVLCAGTLDSVTGNTTTDGRDVCSGDRGGPLVVESPAGRRLAGIVSLGTGCGSHWYGKYMRASAFDDWVDAVIAGTPRPSEPCLGVYTLRNPLGVKVQAVSDTSITVGFRRDLCGPVPDGFTLWRSTPNGWVRHTATNDADATSLVVDGLKPGTSYRLNLDAQRSGNYTSGVTFSTTTSGTTPSPPPPAADTTKPTISGMSPRHRSTTRDTTPTIKAVVRDTRTNLQKSNIKLSVAGKKVTRFRYSAATDKLTYTSPRLTKGKKAVQIVATDAAGNVRAKSWYFTIR